MFMATGSIGKAGRRNLVLAVALIAIIAICTVLIFRVASNKPGWSAGLQIASAIAGAALGNFLRLDFAASTVENQARPSIRRLFDQAARLGDLVQRTEQYRRTILFQISNSLSVDPAQVADWLDGLSRNLRQEINTTATSIDDWGDLAPNVRSEEVNDYTNRESRLPRQLSSESEEGPNS